MNAPENPERLHLFMLRTRRGIDVMIPAETEAGAAHLRAQEPEPHRCSAVVGYVREDLSTEVDRQAENIDGAVAGLLFAEHSAQMAAVLEENEAVGEALRRFAKRIAPLTDDMVASNRNAKASEAYAALKDVRRALDAATAKLAAVTALADALEDPAQLPRVVVTCSHCDEQGKSPRDRIAELLREALATKAAD